jgi:hypothetical protein
MGIWVGKFTYTNDNATLYRQMKQRPLHLWESHFQVLTGYSHVRKLSGELMYRKEAGEGGGEITLIYSPLSNKGNTLGSN